MVHGLKEGLPAFCKSFVIWVVGAALACMIASCGGGGDSVPTPAFSLVRKFVSLSVGDSIALSGNPPAGLIWTSDNPFVEVSNSGRVRALSDHLGAEARATITVTSADSTLLDVAKVTVVNWTANRSSLVVVANPAADGIFLIEGDDIYFNRGWDLYVSNDSFNTANFKGPLPTSPQKMLKTPCGFFLRTETGVYKSGDLTNWSKVFDVRPSVALHHMFSFYYDPETRICYVYTGEYTSGNPDNVHAAYRGTYFPDGRSEWMKIIEFDSLSKADESPRSLNVARHIHVVTVDPYTGHVWVGTGDDNEHSRILYSDNHGDSFKLIGVGDQKWRTLSIWFTLTHVYWNMDSAEPQSIWRVPRSVFDKSRSWPTMTPELSSGMTVPGRRYLVTAAESESYFDVPLGYLYTETKIRTLSSGNRAIAVDDPSYLYYEEVAQLFNGSQWYHSWARNAAGEEILLMGAAPEGALRDWNGRVFGIRERPGLKPDVQELLSVQSQTPDSYLRFLQLEPRGQDTSGYIYFVGRDTPYIIYKTVLNWNDADLP